MKPQTRFWLLALLGLPAYYALLYGVARSDWPWVLGSFAWLFALYGGQWFILQKYDLSPRPASLDWPALVGWGLLLRLGAALALPELSDDYFRFIWDGRLWQAGINPFAALPTAYLADPARAAELGLTAELYAGLNSPEYYTIYPPVLQAIFWLATALFPHSIYGSVLVMKSFVLMGEAVSLGLLLKLLRRFELPTYFVALYALNPLVIVELCGNLHFEALSITFLLASLAALQLGNRPRWLASAGWFALAVATKLVPLMFLPLLIRRLGWGRAIAYGAAVMLLTGLMFAPIFDLPTLRNLAQSIDLYFHQFEFNASFYYLLRAIGYEIWGHNIIRLAGTWLALTALLSILAFALLERRPTLARLPPAMLWTYGLYLSLATVVHPWYATLLLAFATLSRWRWPVVFSALLPLSYFTYRSPAYLENLWLTALIYLVTWAVMLIEQRSLSHD